VGGSSLGSFRACNSSTRACAKASREMNPKYDVVIIDGRHMLWRSSDAFSGLSVRQGPREIATGGIYGFLTNAIRVHERYGGKLMVAWEGDRAKNFRKKLFPDYKKRPPMDEEKAKLHAEMEEAEKRLKILLKMLRVKQYEGEKCEADDVIATLVAKHFPNCERIGIYSGDSDLRQLVCEMDCEVHVIAPLMKGKGDVIYDAEEVQKKHGVMPSAIADLKALAGDTGDGIPGAKGIGPKTAVQLFDFYSADLLKILLMAEINSKDWPCSQRQRMLVAEAADDVRLYRKLTTLNSNVKLLPLGTYPGPPKQKDVLKALRMLRFRSLEAPNELRALMRLSGRSWD
jgi:DNA polymerase I